MRLLSRIALAVMCLLAIGLSAPGAAQAGTADGAVQLPDGSYWTPTATDSVRTGVSTQAFVGCSPGIVCMFEFPNANQGYPGGRWLSASGAGLKNLGWFNDRMQSWANNTGRRWCWYWNADFVNPRFIMEHYGPTRVVNLTRDERNQASSVRPC